MVQIVPPFDLVQKILGAQKVDDRASWRLTTHCVRVERPEGVLFYHALTGELLLLSREEAALLEQLPGPVPPALEELAPRWFLRPENADDMALADQVRQIGSRLAKEKTALTRYTIFTTTACNARCFYCYEKRWEKGTMTEQTALDTARYIAAHCGGKPIHLQWFGGEPLVNRRAIDIITDFLRRQGLPFRSTMMSNGYLFDHALVQRAKSVWNLKKIRITLDGTEEVYNQRKAYVNPQGSPYQRVLRNMDLLLEAGVEVNVRLNMDENNERDLYGLVDVLAEKFGDKPGFGVHLLEIQEYGAENESLSRAEEVRRSYTEKLRSLRVYVEKKGISARLSLNRGVAINACRADSGKATTVMPDGRLGLCEEACKEGDIWGSIYSEERDEEVLRQWRERLPAEEVCRTCGIYPQCIRLKKCPGVGNCSTLKQLNREDRLHRAILGTYEEWKAIGGTDKE